MVECTYMYCGVTLTVLYWIFFILKRTCDQPFCGPHRATLILFTCVGMLTKILYIYYIEGVRDRSKWRRCFGDHLFLFFFFLQGNCGRRRWLILYSSVHGSQTCQMLITKLTGICIVFVQCLWNSAVTDHVPSRRPFVVVIDDVVAEELELM